jgi:hypothetical protein
MARSLLRHETMRKLEGNSLVIRIAQSTGLQPEKVAEVVQLALEEIHRIAIVDEKGPTAAVMEACFSFGEKAAFHLIGLYVSEHDYHGRGDDAGIWNEVAMRFIPTAYAEGCDRMAPWFSEKTPDRLLLDADKPRRPRRPNVGMIFGRMVRRLGRDSGDAQLAKAGEDLIRRSYEELEESEPDSASLTNSSAQSVLDPAPNSPGNAKSHPPAKSAAEFQTPSRHLHGSRKK